MLTELMKSIDGFVSKYGAGQPKLKDDLLELVEKAIAHGENKDQNKIVGIAGKLIKNFIGGKD
jgi:hypothetical protein